MTAPAITPTGLLIPTVTDLQATLAADQKATVDPLILTAADGVDGQFNGIFASHLREVYEVIQVLYDALDPDNAEDELLDRDCALTGTIRLPATFSTFKASRQIVVNIDPGTLPAGNRASVLNHPEIVFETLEDAVNSGLSAADVPVDAQCVVTGPVAVNAGTLTVIATPFPGWHSVTNPLDAAIGADVESDTLLRPRRVVELTGQGATGVDSIRAKLLAMQSSADPTQTPILEAVVLSNDTDNVDVNGLLPHSVEAVIWDGPSLNAANADVAAVLFANVDPGTRTLGTTLVNVADSYGYLHPVYFTRTIQRSITCVITLRYAAGYAGDAAVKAALAAGVQTGLDANGRPILGLRQQPGKVVSFSAWMAVVQSVPGVVRIESLSIVFSGGPVPFTDLTPAAREIGVTDTSLMTVSSSSI
jgi:Baseplate J-like protein